MFKKTLFSINAQLSLRTIGKEFSNEILSLNLRPLHVTVIDGETRVH